MSSDPAEIQKSVRGYIRVFVMLMIFTIIISIAVLPWGGIKQTTKEITIPANTNWKEAAREHIV